MASPLSPSLPQLVELKNGETYNGTLESCDSWMNILLTQVICTSRVSHTPTPPILPPQPSSPH